MGQRFPTRVLAGSVLLPALLFLNLVACGPEAEPLEQGAPERAEEFEVSMDVEPNPPKSGQRAELTFEVLRGGEPVEELGGEPRLVTDMPEMPMNLPEISLEDAGRGRWKASVEFPMAGGWAATLALPDAGEEVTFEFEVSP